MANLLWQGAKQILMFDRERVNTREAACYYYKKYIIKTIQLFFLSESSCVKFGAVAFVDPFNYTLVNNSAGPEITQLAAYLEGTVSNPGPLTLKVNRVISLI